MTDAFSREEGNDRTRAIIRTIGERLLTQKQRGESGFVYKAIVRVVGGVYELVRSKEGETCRRSSRKMIFNSFRSMN